jgi:hypothetical protein
MLVAKGTPMTEPEWLTTDDGEEMLAHLRNASDRKLRLFAAAVWRRRWRGDETQRRVVETFVRYLDGEVSGEDWFAAYSGAGGALLDDHVQCLLAPDPRSAIRRVAGQPGLRLRLGMQRYSLPVDLLRDIFGNPFRPVRIDPLWRTPDVLALARHVLTNGDFSALPLLADALEDACCTNADILAHCRGGGNHSPGCWALDAILGKS